MSSQNAAAPTTEVVPAAADVGTSAGPYAATEAANATAAGLIFGGL
jgi:hypothetical protein